MDIDTLFHGFLVCTAGGAMYKISYDTYPFAFAACTIGFVHGAFGLMSTFRLSCVRNTVSRTCIELKKMSMDLLEFAPLSLINVELYRKCGCNYYLAMAHLTFVIPLSFNFLARWFGYADDLTCNIETLKDLTTLGNVVSLMILAMMDDHKIYAGIALSALLARFAAKLFESMYEGAYEKVAETYYIIMFFLTCKAFRTMLEEVPNLVTLK